MCVGGAASSGQGMLACACSPCIFLGFGGTKYFVVPDEIEQERPISSDRRRFIYQIFMMTDEKTVPPLRI